MKINNKNIISLVDKYDLLKSYKMPVKVSRCLLRNYRLLIDNYIIYKEQLDKLFNSYAARDESGSIIYGENNLPLINEDNVDSFNSEINDLLGLEINIPFETFSEEIFDNWDDDKYDVLSAEDLDALYLMTTPANEEVSATT